MPRSVGDQLSEKVRGDNKKTLVTYVKLGIKIIVKAVILLIKFYIAVFKLIWKIVDFINRQF